MTSIARLCVDDFVNAIKVLEPFAGKTYQIFSEEELFDKTKGLVYPCAGIVYEGMKPVTEHKETHRVGLSVELVASVMILFKSSAVAVGNAKMDAVDVLDLTRGAMKDRRSPSGHYWNFRLEAAANAKGGVLVYIQRWSTPVQLA